MSNVLKLVVSQMLVNDVNGDIVLVPEIMTVNNTISALIRQEKFSLSEIQDAVHHVAQGDSISFERSFTNLFKDNIINMNVIENSVDQESLNLITNLIGGGY